MAKGMTLTTGQVSPTRTNSSVPSRKAGNQEDVSAPTGVLQTSRWGRVVFGVALLGQLPLDLVNCETDRIHPNSIVSQRLFAV